uniref:Tetraspanin 1 n=1 Tax=Sinocyclocheilus rhinocerous TaxID=307959 RepID=A0A673IS69_9TELE
MPICQKWLCMCLAAAGIWVTVDGDSFMKVLPPFTDDFQSHVNVGIFSITIGAVMTLLGLLGCCGAQKESKCLLIMFFSIILIICIAETAATIVALVYSSYTEIILRAWATPGLKEQYGKDKILTDLWNSTMTTLQCCGFSNYTDFSESYYYKQNGTLYPPTCCAGPDRSWCVKKKILQAENESSMWDLLLGNTYAFLHVKKTKTQNAKNVTVFCEINNYLTFRLLLKRFSASAC